MEKDLFDDKKTVSSTEPEKDIKVEKVEPEMVNIEKERLDAILKRLERVESAADKARLFHYDTKNREEIGKEVRLGVWNDGTKERIILAWTNMPVNKCEKNPMTGAWNEDQKVTLILEDDEQITMPYLSSVSTSRSSVKAEVLSETKDKDGNIVLEVETKDGKKYNIDSKFINL